MTFLVVLVMSMIMMWIPRYTYSHDIPTIVTCTLSLLFNATLLSSMMLDSWCATVFWLVSGVILVLQSLIKCDVLLCCLCSDYPEHSSHSTVLLEERLIPNVQSRPTTTIRLKNPPMGSSVINHVQTRR